LVRKILLGLKSLWMKWCLWIYAKPFT